MTAFPSAYDTVHRQARVMTQADNALHLLPDTEQMELKRADCRGMWLMSESWRRSFLVQVEKLPRDITIRYKVQETGVAKT